MKALFVLYLTFRRKKTIFKSWNNTIKSIRSAFLLKFSPLSLIERSVVTILLFLDIAL